MVINVSRDLLLLKLNIAFEIAKLSASILCRCVHFWSLRPGSPFVQYIFHGYFHVFDQCFPHVLPTRASHTCFLHVLVSFSELTETSGHMCTKHECAITGFGRKCGAAKPFLKHLDGCVAEARGELTIDCILNKCCKIEFRRI